LLHNEANPGLQALKKHTCANRTAIFSLSI
jgi:hypothetical protein